MTEPARADAFLGSCFTRRDKGACNPQLGNNFRDVSINSALIFVGLTSMVFSWGSRVQWPRVNEQVFKLEGLINYVVPMGFLEVMNEFEYP